MPLKFAKIDAIKRAETPELKSLINTIATAIYKNGLSKLDRN